MRLAAKRRPLRSFFELGGDSIVSIQLIGRARKLGLALTTRQVFEHPSLRALGRVLKPLAEAAALESRPEGSVPLTPIQSLFFQQPLAAPAHYNQSLLLQTRQRLKAEALRAAVHGLLRQHDALRLRFERGAEGEWRQGHAPLSEEVVAQSCAVIELSSSSISSAV